MSLIYFIDPMSKGNMSMYDIGVLGKIKQEHDITLFGSNRWDCDMIPEVNMQLLFNYNNKSNVFTKALSYISTLIRIYQLAKRQHPALIHIQWGRIPLVDTLFVQLLKRKGVKVIHTAHNLLPHNSDLSKKQTFLKYYNAVNHIIVHSYRTRDEMIQMFEMPDDKISVIPHGLLFTKQSALTEKRVGELRIIYNLCGKLVFSVMGNMSAYKGIDLIVKAWSETPELYSNRHIHLFIIGENQGVDFDKLRNLDNVTIIEKTVSSADFESYLRLSDVTLLPYRQISQSGVLLSSIGCDTPILVSDVGGLTEPLQYGNIGWNMGVPSYGNLVSALRYLIANPEEVHATKHNTHEFEKVKNHYSWDNISLMTNSLYNKLIDNISQ